MSFWMFTRPELNKAVLAPTGELCSASAIINPFSLQEPQTIQTNAVLQTRRPQLPYFSHLEAIIKQTYIEQCGKHLYLPLTHSESNNHRTLFAYPKRGRSVEDIPQSLPTIKTKSGILSWQ